MKKDSKDKEANAVPAEEVKVTPVAETTAVKSKSKKLPVWAPWVAAGLVVVLASVTGFAIGRGTAGNTKNAGVNRDATTAMRGQGAGVDAAIPQDARAAGGETRSRSTSGTSGTVKAISSDSITITDTRRGGTVTYKITSDTKITSGGTEKSTSDIKTGDTVAIQASSSDSSVAATITIST